METQPREPGRAAGLVLLIVLLGFALRGSGLVLGQAYSYFGQGDGIAAYTVAVDFGRGEERALYIGQPNYNEHSKLPGPLWTIFCFLGLRLGGSIQGVIWAVILLNTALIYLVYLLGERTVGHKAALWAALFTATFPWPVYYSVGVYNPDVMGFLGALLFLALWRASQQDKSRSVAWVLVLLFALPQFHMSGLMLIPAVVVVLWLSPARLNISWLLVGLIAGSALYLPYLAGDMAHGWQNTRGMFSGKGGYSWDSLKALSIPPGLICNWAPRWTRTMAEHRQMGAAICTFYPVLLLLNVVSGVLTMFIIAGIFCRIRTALYGVFRAPRAIFSDAPGPAFLSLLCVIPLGFALVSGKPFHSRYALVLLAPFMSLAGAAAAYWLQPQSLVPAAGNWWARNRPAFKRLFTISLMVTLCANVWLVPSMYRFQGRQIETSPTLLPSWRKLESIYTALKTHAGSEQSVEVDDTAYLQALPRGDKFPRDAALVRRYVTVREKERLMASSRSLPAVVYLLRDSKDVTPGDASVAYSGHGIALVAATR